MIPVLGVLHLADLYREPKYRLPSYRDWAKIPLFLSGDWPKPIPPRFELTEESVAAGFAWFEAAKRAPWVVVDFEYLHHGDLKLLGMGFPGMTRGLQAVWPSLPGWLKREVQGWMQALFQNVTLVSQNAVGAELPVFEQVFQMAYPTFHRVDDTMLAHAVLWSEWPHDLAFLASLYGVYPKLKHLARTDLRQYNWGDVIDTICVWEGLLREFKDDPASWETYETESRGLIPLILDAHRRGIAVNKPRVAPAAVFLEAQESDATQLAASYAGFPLNLGSSTQLCEYLYRQENLPLQRQPRSSTPTVAKDAIAKLRALVGPEPDPDADLTIEVALARIDEGAHPVLEARVLYANAVQARAHYLTPLFEEDGTLKDRVFPQFHIHAQANARWSTVDPPLAQLPRALRDIIVPDPGTVWLGYDWDQIELRINAALSDDQPTLEAFEKGWDVHTLNACACFGWPFPPERIKPWAAEANRAWLAERAWTFGDKEDPRRVFAKRFEFRLDYGGLAQNAGTIPGASTLGLDVKALVAASSRWLLAHPQKAQWRREIAGTVSKRGLPTLRTFLGRRRIFLAEGAKRVREALDFPMQAGVSGIANRVAIALKHACPWLWFVWQMHDGWWWGCPEERIDATWPRMRAIVQQPWTIRAKAIAFPAEFKQVCPVHLDCLTKKRRPV